MKSFTPCRLWFIVLGSLACGSTGKGLYESGNGTFDDGLPPGQSSGTLKAAALSFPGGGTSGAARPLSAALAPQTSLECDPEPTASALASDASVQTVCFFGADSSDVPAATIEQVVEVVGTAEWVHIRLTLNPNFVDNTYGTTAIGWDREDDAAAPAVPPDAPAPKEPKPVAGPGRGDPGGGGPAKGGAGKGGHTFDDLLGSDHAEISLLDTNGAVAMHFKLDYISKSESAASGFASLGVSGGEGQLIVGEPEWVLATATSIDRNLNGCGLSSFTENSPAADAAYTPSADATDWDYRVAYEVWVSSEAFGSAGFGSALIDNVHASPSKVASNTVDVLPAPCPIDPGSPEATPEPLPVVLQNIR